MIRTSVLILGIVALFFFAMIGLTIVPKAYIDPAMADYDVYIPFSVQQGHQIYVRDGCVYCHSQQTRPEGFGADFERGWGRASVGQDYIGFKPHVLGTMRTGPDLANIGVRQPSREWHYIHLYQPRAVVKESIMPPYPWLFDVFAETSGQTQQAGLNLNDPYGMAGKKIVPKDEAEALVDYLLYLNQKEREKKPQ